MIKDEAVQTLVNLGLTVLQAKTYLALAKLDTSTGRTTAKAANIHPSDIYRILAELKEKGLVKKIVSKPNKYSAVTLPEGSLMLLHQREKQTLKIKETINQMCKYYTVPDERQNNDESNEFILELYGKTCLNKFEKMVETAQTSLDLMANYNEAMMYTSECVIKSLFKNLNNGVKIRQIFNLSQERPKAQNWFVKIQKKTPTYQARFLDCSNPVTLVIKDNEVLVGLGNDVKREQPHLWSNNPVLVQIIKGWYNSLWEE